MRYLDALDLDDLHTVHPDFPLRGEAFPHLKPRKRNKNLRALKRFRLEHIGEPCEICEARQGTEVHHRLFRSQGGGDQRSNLCWICHTCHRGIHDGTIPRP